MGEDLPALLEEISDLSFDAEGALHSVREGALLPRLVSRGVDAPEFEQRVVATSRDAAEVRRQVDARMSELTQFGPDYEGTPFGELGPGTDAAED